MRTSLTHPLRIAELPIGAHGGAVGVTFAPGKRQENALTGAWARDLDFDLQVIRAWGAAHLISLLEPQEFDDLQIPGIAERATAHGLAWYGLPITDGAAPDDRFLVPGKLLGRMFVAVLLDGGRIVVHCKGGLGRAGTVASMLLLESVSVTSADDAMRQVRATRPGAIETIKQEVFLHAWATVLHGIAGKPYFAEGIDYSAETRRVLAIGEEVFRSRANAILWFNAPLQSFERQTPAELVRTGRSGTAIAYLQSISSGYIG